MTNPETQQALQAFVQARRAGASDDALEAAVTATTLSRADGDPIMLMRSLNAEAQAQRDLGHAGAAGDRYRELAALCVAQNDPLAEAHALRHLADLHLEAGALGEAASTYARVLGLYHASRDEGSLDLANALRGYALLRERLGERQEAEALWREARSLYAQAGIEAGIDECDEHLVEMAP